jgi:hypothetical protein
MMPMQMPRKGWKLEKVENLYRTATAQKIFPTCPDKSDHACAIPWTAEAKRPDRSPCQI